MTKKQEKQINNLKKKIDRLYSKLAEIKSDIKEIRKEGEVDLTKNVSPSDMIKLYKVIELIRMLQLQIIIPVKYEIVNALEDDNENN